MKYTVGYLTKQLAEASKISDHHREMLIVHPDDIALRIAARSMDDHVAEIERDLRKARREESKMPVTSTAFTGKGKPTSVIKVKKREKVLVS